MSSKNFLTIIALALFNIISGQNFSTQKTIVDSNTKLPLANVSIFNDSNSTITNDEGNFIFVSNQNEINISNIGYESLKVSFNQLPQQDTLFLKSKIIELDEIVIATNASTIMQKVFKNVPKNHSKAPYNELFFLRCILKKDGKIIRFQDFKAKKSASSFYREYNTKTKKTSKPITYNIEILNMRKAGINLDKNIYFKFNTFSQLSLFFGSIFINTNTVKTKKININEPHHIKLNFSPKTENESKTSNGYCIIDTLDYVIKEFNEEIEFKESNPYKKSGAIKFRSLNLNIKIKLTKASNGKYFINNASSNEEIEIITEEKIKTIYNVSYQLFTEKSFIADEVKSNCSENKDVFKINFDYSEDFWKNQNQLPLTSELKDFLSKLDDNKRSEFKITSNFKK